VTRPVIKETETNRGSVEKDSEALPVDVDKWKEKQGEDGNMKSLIEALKDGKKCRSGQLLRLSGKKRRHCGHNGTVFVWSMELCIGFGNIQALVTKPYKLWYPKLYENRYLT
jgi:hypothetical protein